MGRKLKFIKLMWAFNETPGDVTPPSGGGGNADPATIPGDTSDGSRIIEVPTMGASSDAPANGGGVDWNALVPTDQRDKPYFQNILKSADPGAELVKQFANAQELIGKRPAGLPDANATDEDWAKYRESVRPKTAEEYEFKPTDLGEEHKDVAEFVNRHRDEASIKELKGIFHDIGVPAKQASELVDKLDKWYINKSADIFKTAITDEQAKSDSFDQLVKTSFGADKDAALKYGREYIAKHVPDSIKPFLKDMPNEALIAFAAAGLNEKKMYNTEDTVNAGNNNVGASVLELRTEVQKLMSSEAGRSKFHPEYELTQQKIQGLCKQIAAVQNKK